MVKNHGFLRSCLIKNDFLHFDYIFITYNLFEDLSVDYIKKTTLIWFLFNLIYYDLTFIIYCFLLDRNSSKSTVSIRSLVQNSTDDVFVITKVFVA